MIEAAGELLLEGLVEVLGELFVLGLESVAATTSTASTEEPKPTDEELRQLSAFADAVKRRGR
jgi:hypothetical protein